MHLRIVPRRGPGRQWCLLLACTFLSIAAHAAAPDRVMLLVSYHAGMAWSDDQIAGVRQQLAPLGDAIELELDFLDTKHVQPSPQYYQQVEDLLLTKYGPTPPKVLLATDDDALDFALRMRQRHYPGVPILFSGVAGSRSSALAAEQPIAGVFDDIDVGKNLTLMLGLRPQTRRLVVVHDQSRTSLAQVQTLREVAARYPNVALELLTRMDVASIQSRLRALDHNDLVFALAFNRDANNRILTHEEASDLWAAASNAPVAVIRDVSMRPGVLGGYLVTGLQQGDILGHMALQVLQHTPASTLPLRAGVALPTFNYAELQRWDMADAVLPPDAVILNRPPSTLAVLRPHLAWLLALFGSMLVIIGLLLHGIRVRQRSEAALRQSAQNYSALFNSSSDAILVRDAASHVIVDTNPRFRSLYGYQPEEIPNLSIADLCLNEPPYTEADGLQWMQKTLKEGPQFYEWRSRRKDGSIFWAEVSMTRFVLPQGERIVSTIRDISDRKLVETQAREFEHRMQQVYENLPVGVFAVDARHQLTFWNAQMTRLTGVPAQDVVGTADCWRGFYTTARPCLVNVVVNGSRVADLERFYHGRLRVSAVLSDAVEGEDFFPRLNAPHGMWLRYCAAPLRDAQGQITGAIQTVMDVTELKASQKSLKELNQQLEGRVQARTDELQRAMGQLVQSEKLAALGSLVAGVAHELNTPIGNVIAVASTLKDEVTAFSQRLLSGTARRSEVSDSARRLQEASELIERNAARAATLVAGFKEVAVDQSSSRRRTFNLRDTVQEVLTTMAPAFRKAPFHISVDMAADIALDSFPGPLEQVLNNFLTNSLKHAFEGRTQGHIAITAQVDGDDVVLAYADDGCGIAPNNLSHLFEPFYTTKLGQGGSGLGLYIVHNLVTGVLGGAVSASSVPQHGTTFTVRLPRRAPGQGATR